MQLAKLLHIGVNKQITYIESIEGNNLSLEYLFLDISPIWWLLAWVSVSESEKGSVEI